MTKITVTDCDFDCLLGIISYRKISSFSHFQHSVRHVILELDSENDRFQQNGTELLLKTKMSKLGTLQLTNGDKKKQKQSTYYYIVHMW